MPVRNKNIKFFVNWLLGPILFVWLSSSLYYQIRHQPDLVPTLQAIGKSITGTKGYILPLVLALMILNWSLEALKWKQLLRHLEPIGFLQSLKAVLAGVAFAVNTPNRMGEYGGRILYVKEGHRLDAVSLSIAGGIAQLLVTLWMGCGSLVYLLNRSQDPAFRDLIAPQNLWLRLCLSMMLVISLGLTLFYFRISWLAKWLEKMPGFHRFQHHLQVLEDLHVTSLLRVFLLSLLRYTIFVFQYILMLELMQVTLSFWQSWWFVSLLFFVLAVIPTIALAELGIRGSISLQIFGWLSSNAAGILAVSVSIWFINLVIPALAGSLLMLGVRIVQQKEKLA